MQKRGDLDWYDMAETPYRASQVCRVLGNPKTYQILRVLRDAGPATPSEISASVDRSVATVSRHLKTLREVQLVRYQRNGLQTVYRLKNTHVGRILNRLERLVLVTRTEA